MSEHGKLIDLIYDAALDPTVWPEVLAALARPIGGTAGWLSQLNKLDGSGGNFDDPTWRIDPAWRQAFLEHYGAVNLFGKSENVDEYMRRWSMAINTFDTQISREKLVKSEYYNDFLRPQDVETCLMIRVSRSKYTVAVVNINGPSKRDRFDSAEIAWAAAWQPHLVRAFDMGRRLAEERRASSAGLNAKHAVFMLDEFGRVRRMNTAAEGLIGRSRGLRVIAQRLVADRPEDSRKLEALVRRALSRDPEFRSGGGLSLTSSDDTRPIALSVAPLSAERAWPYQLGPAAVVCATDLNERLTVRSEQLQALFGLTAAEVRIALAIANSETPREIAERLGVSFQTVRNQLASIYAKTSTRGQVDLVGLVWRVAASS